MADYLCLNCHLWTKERVLLIIGICRMRRSEQSEGALYILRQTFEDNLGSFTSGLYNTLYLFLQVLIALIRFFLVPYICLQIL